MKQANIYTYSITSASVAKEDLLIEAEGTRHLRETSRERDRKGRRNAMARFLEGKKIVKKN